MPAAVAALALLTAATACSGDGGGGNKAEVVTSPAVATTGATASSPAPTPTPTDDTAALELAKKAREGLLAAGSVTVAADQPTVKNNPANRYSTDLQGNCVAEKTMATGKFLIRKVGNESWSHPDREWLKANPGKSDPADFEATAALMTKWRPATEAVLKEHQELCSLQAVADLIWSDNPATKTRKVIRVGTGTVGRTPVIVLRSGSLVGAATVSVAADGSPYPVKIEFESSGGRPSGTLTLGGFGEKVPATRPSADEIWDPKKS